MKTSCRINTIETSYTRQLFDLARTYTDVIDLTLGDPDVVPGERIRTAACNAVNAGKTRYSSNAGLPELRECLADQFRLEYGIDIDSNKNVIATVGGMEGLYLALQCIVDAGDEVLIFAPYYVNYVHMVQICGGVPVIINTKEERNFMVSPEQVRDAITGKTVALIINNPANPTGQVMGNDLIDEIAQIVREKDLWVISDEVYKSLIYDGRKHESIITRPEMLERTILVDSLSKRFAMTGYRIGYVVAPDNIVSGMTKLQENIAACAPLPSQHAAIAAYKNYREDKQINQIFLVRRDLMFEAICEIKNLSCKKPPATFYLFVNIKETHLDSVTFARKLLEKKQVAVAPGITYGAAYDHFIRIACTLEIDRLLQGAKRLKDFAEQK